MKHAFRVLELSEEWEAWRIKLFTLDMYDLPLLDSFALTHCSVVLIVWSW